VGYISTDYKLTVTELFVCYISTDDKLTVTEFVICVLYFYR
jgi:hypothetical protein